MHTTTETLLSREVRTRAGQIVGCEQALDHTIVIKVAVHFRGVALSSITTQDPASSRLSEAPARGFVGEHANKTIADCRQR